MTTVADGLYQYGGQPVSAPFLTSKLFSRTTGNYPKGRAWFVDPSAGTSGNGRSPGQAFSTMAAAFAVLKSGDIIYMIGKVTEQLVTPVNVFDVTVVGCGNRPRHADASPAGGAYSAAQWAPASGGTAAQATVRVLQQGWRFVNILFTAIDANAAMIELVRDAGAGDLERDASHASILGCRFAGAGVGVRMTATGFAENPFNILIQGNTFNGCTIGISAVVAQPNMVQILDNFFPSNTSAIVAKLQASTIKGNTIGIFTAAGNSGGIDVRSGGANNFITGNWLGGAYSKAGGYNTEANDSWWGNFADVAGGVTQSDPA